MTGRLRLRIAVATLAAGLLPGANALAEAGFYSGFFGGMSMADMGSKGSLDEVYFGDLPLDSSSLDDSDGTYGVQVGYRWNSYIAAEIGYVNLGEGVYEAAISDPAIVPSPIEFSARFRSTGPTLSVLGTLPAGERFDFHGRLGAYYSDTRYRERLEDPDTGETASIEFDGNSIDAFAGIGAAWNINASYTLRVEYQRFFDVGDEEETPEADIDLLMFGVLFR